MLVLANDCRDDTVAVAQAWAEQIPHPVTVVSESLPADRRSAGWARRRAMELAAERLTAEAAGGDDERAILVSTDADTCASPTWMSATLAAFLDGADAVTGYLDVHPAEMVALGPTFLARSRIEDRYLRLLGEIRARCDPRPHDPWPNHRFASGASLAVTLAAFRAVGGIPPRTAGEDAAFAHALDDAGFRVRHSLDVHVATSCRLEGRAVSGAAETMKHRHTTLDALCDDDVEPALLVTRRALRRRRSRERWLREHETPVGFASHWDGEVARDPELSTYRTLRPSQLPRQIERARVIVRLLRASARLVTS